MEGLAFQNLQNELGASILREVEIELTNSQRVRVDGLLQTSGGTVAVEVFLVRDASTAPLDRARELCNLFTSAVREGSKAKKPYRLIEVFVLTGGEPESAKAAVMKFASRTNYPVDVRVFSAMELTRKFGIPA
jgi:hypothetical protein